MRDAAMPGGLLESMHEGTEARTPPDRAAGCRGVPSVMLAVSAMSAAMAPAHAQSAILHVSATVPEVAQVQEIALSLDDGGRSSSDRTVRRWRITAGRGIEIGIVVDNVVPVPAGLPSVTVCTVEQGLARRCRLETMPSRHLCGPSRELLLGVDAALSLAPRSGTTGGLRVTLAYTAN